MTESHELKVKWRSLERTGSITAEHAQQNDPVAASTRRKLTLEQWLK